MKTVNIYKYLAIVAFLVAGLSGCIMDKEIAVPENPKGDKMVTISMSVPGAATPRPSTRSLTPEGEQDITAVTVMLFYPSSHTKAGQFYTMRPGTTIGGTGKNRSFEIKVPVGTYDFVVLANAQEAIGGATISEGMTKAQIMPLLNVSNTAKWTSGGTAPVIPMWGEKTDFEVTESTTHISTTTEPIKMHRMLAKVEVRLSNLAASGSDTDETGTGNFALGSVHLYNPNTRGRVAPDNTGANWTVGDGTTLNPERALKPTLPSNVGKVAAGTSFAYTGDDDATATGTPAYGEYFGPRAVKNTIYTFEASNTDAMSAAERPCVVIGGYFKGSTEQTYYRVDFVDMSTGTLAYLDLVRNHNYVFMINSIKGEGLPTPDEAYNSHSTNIEAEVLDWNEEYTEGYWNGIYHILFTDTKADFTQFGTPSPQVIKIQTDCPDLIFDNFTNVTKGTVTGEGNWTPETAADEGTWTNGHFTVVIVKGTTSGGETEYTLTITAEPTTDVATDPFRDTRFKVKGQNMEANIRITQDAHVQYRLLTEPDPGTAIMIDGVEQRIRVDVTSTHPYDVVYTNSMFTGVYAAAYGDNPLPLTGIPETRTTVYIQVDEHVGSDPLIGEVTFRHSNTGSDAGSRIYRVVQVTPSIEASLAGGTPYEAEIPKAGGTATINVRSNMTAWVPQLEIKVGDAAKGPLTGLVTDYFDVAQGGSNATVTFRLGALADTETEDRVYYITFKDANGNTVTTPEIKITQKAKLLGGGGGGTPPTGGVRGEPGILSVNSKGQLNLDGDGWIVYFKWGSTIAIAGGKANDVFGGSEDIAWVPEGYPYKTLVSAIEGQSTAENQLLEIPLLFSGTAIIENASAGTGDPCRLALKDGAVGEYKMPSGNPYNGYSSMAAWTTKNGSKGRYDISKTQFYPAAGYMSTNGIKFQVGMVGWYWSSSSRNESYRYYLHFWDTTVNTTMSSLGIIAAPIRCVRE